jgi:hypothetical protein
LRRFYILGLTFVGLLVSSTDERLLNANNPYAEGTSPFVLAAKDAGLRGYDSFMNVVILVSVVSIGVSCVYGGSRTLTALAEQGYAPKIFTYIDRSGRPLMSVSINLAFGALAYVTLASSGSIVFSWLLALSGLAALFTWGSICVVSSLYLPLLRAVLTGPPGTHPLPRRVESQRPHARRDSLQAHLRRDRLLDWAGPRDRRPRRTVLHCHRAHSWWCQRRRGFLPGLPRATGRVVLLGVWVSVEAEGVQEVE